MSNCSKCTIELSDENWTASCQKQGDTVCKSCKRIQSRTYYLSNQVRINELVRASYPKRLAANMLDRAKRRAKEKNLEFNLEITDIIIPEKCPVFNKKFIIGSNNNYSPSLDRIDNSKGYIKGNVQVISRKANTIKSNATPEEVMLVAKFMEK